MTKEDIAVQLSQRLKIEKPLALQVMGAVKDILSEALISGENVYLRGFGTFEVKTAKEKLARNISKGIAVVVPEHKTVKLKLSQDLKNRINGK